MNGNQVFEMICAALDERQWRYDRNDDKLAVTFKVSGDDFPMEIVMVVDDDRKVVRLLSPIGFKMSEDKRMEGAIAVCAASHGLVDGNWDYDISDGSIIFRMTASYLGSTLGKGLFQYMISYACTVVDEYNDKFFTLQKGLTSIEAFFD